MADIKLEIELFKRTTAEQTAQPERNATEQQAEDNSAMSAAAYMVSKKLAKGAAARVGKVTGSAMAQETTSLLMQGGGFIAAATVNPAMAVATAAADIAIKAFDYVWKIKQAEKDRERTAQRIGYRNTGGR